MIAPLPVPTAAEYDVLIDLAITAGRMLEAGSRGEADRVLELVRDARAVAGEHDLGRLGGGWLEAMDRLAATCVELAAEGGGS